MKKLLILSLMVFGSILFISCDNTTTVIETTTQTTLEETTTLQSTTTQITTIPPTTIIETTEGVEYTAIELTNQSKKFYHLDETFDKTSIEITATLSDGSKEIISSELIQVRGFSSTTSGVKSVYLVFNKFYVETEICILKENAIEIHMDYYESAINYTGEFLRVQLNEIISTGFVPLLYGDARNILQESDVDPNNNQKLVLVYTGLSVNKYWDSGVTWNREHVWPQSRLGVYVSYSNDFPSKATDIHNLKPADPDENYIRSNDYFNDNDGEDFYVPRDEVKGDVARIIFYMATKYHDLTLNDDETTNSPFKTMGLLSVLLLWNEQDPVDDFERNRNEVLYSYQGNRNPFIDYPEFANSIWDIVT